MVGVFADGIKERLEGGRWILVDYNKFSFLVKHL